MVRLALIVGLLTGLAACDKAAPPAAQPSAAPAQPDYHPSLGDMMTMAVQPRHTKLGLAGKARNWPYAAYEASELKGAFARIGRTIPTYRKANLAETANANMQAPLGDVAAAIKAKDGAAFDAAYAKVTAGCNACHLSLAHPEVVIRAPEGPAFPDQDFKAR